jgi:hypothetical protein
MWRFVAGIVVGLSFGAATAAVSPKVEGQGVLSGWSVTKDGEEVCRGPYVVAKRREIACESVFRLGRIGTPSLFPDSAVAVAETAQQLVADRPAVGRKRIDVDVEADQRRPFAPPHRIVRQRRDVDRE